MKALIVHWYLQEPILATQAQNGEPNSSVSSIFIPGSMLRGALISKYTGGKEKDLHSDAQFRELFFSGKVKFLNAYPIHPVLKERMLPKPQSWQVLKEDVGDPEAEILDFALLEEVDDEIYKPVKGEYFQFVDEYVQLGTPQLETTVHNTSQDRDRKQEGVSQVYRYDALAAGQTFVGVILSEEKDLLEETFRPMLEGEYLLGGSYGSGYGRTVVQDVKFNGNWQEYDRLNEEPEKCVILTFLSDVILDSGATTEVQEALAGMAGEPVMDAFYSVGLVGGFNRKWGLPLPQAWAIKAGSVFVFPPAARNKLEALAESGIGSRQVDGFGRVAVNLSTTARLDQSPLRFPRDETEMVALSEESRALAERLSERQLRFTMDRYIAGQISKLCFTRNAFSYLPKSSQLMRARLAARKAVQTGSLQAISDHFEGLTNLTRRSWMQAKIGGKSLEGWILEQVAAADKFSPVTAPKVAGVQAEMTAELRNQGVARIIEGVLKQAAKQSSRSVEGGAK